MAGRTVDVIAAGPCPAGPYDPGAPAWALAVGIAAWGDRVRVIHPPGPAGGPPPGGVEELVVDVARRRPGAAIEEATFAELAGRRLRPDAELVVRDPLGLGRLRPAAGGRSSGVVGVVRGLERVSYDRDTHQRKSSGWIGRVDAWRDRRALQRLEAEALGEAERLCYDDPDVATLLHREYGIDRSLLTEVPSAVASGVSPTREAARKNLRLPLDVLVVAAPLASDEPTSPQAHAVVEAFHRARSLFAGARLVAVGAPPPRVEPGASWNPDRSTTAFEVACAAADVAIVAPSSAGLDPGAVLALRAGCAVLANPLVRFPTDPGSAVRYAPTAEAADLAASLAELLADGEQRRRLADAGRRFAERFDPERVAAVVTAERRRVAA